MRDMSTFSMTEPVAKGSGETVFVGLLAFCGLVILWFSGLVALWFSGLVLLSHFHLF